jgi:hypothetical protein
MMRVREEDGVGCFFGNFHGLTMPKKDLKR